MRWLACSHSRRPNGTDFRSSSKSLCVSDCRIQFRPYYAGPYPTSKNCSSSIQTTSADTACIGTP